MPGLVDDPTESETTYLFIIIYNFEHKDFTNSSKLWPVPFAEAERRTSTELSNIREMLNAGLSLPHPSLPRRFSYNTPSVLVYNFNNFLTSIKSSTTISGHIIFSTFQCKKTERKLCRITCRKWAIEFYAEILWLKIWSFKNKFSRVKLNFSHYYQLG